MILQSSDMKFVVLVGEQTEVLRTLPCRHGTEDIYHADIKRLAQQELGKKLSCPGGGRIHIDHQGKVITAYGKSTAYGPAEPEVVRRLLAKVMEDEGMTEYALVVDMDV